MNLNNKTLAAMILAGLTALTSTSALANQEIQGEFFSISSGTLGGYCYAENDKAKLKEEIVNKIRAQALIVCGDRDYSIEKPRIAVSQNHFINHPCDREFRMTGTATVFCKN